jgi:V/A-type H+-transporting ATPase subunit F
MEVIMQFYCISDNIDTQIGMRLAGIEGVLAHDTKQVCEELDKAFSDEKIGIVLIAEKLIKLCPDVIYEYKLNRKRPLIVEIPDRHGTSQVSDSISRYVREAVGISI